MSSLNLADVVDAAVRGGVHLDQVQKRSVGDGLAVVAAAAGFGLDAFQAVDRLGQQPCGGCLARSPFARKQVGMAEPVVDQGVLEGPNHVFLANELVEPLRTVAVIESLKRRRTRRGHGSLPA